MKRYIKRKYIQLYRKIVHEKASPEYIARGWAVGMFFGCLLPFGVQLFFSVPAAFLLRGSKIGAVMGTFITNHFTIFLIYPLQCYFGSMLIGNPLSYGDITSAMSEVLDKQDWNSLLALGGNLVAAFFAGGFVFAAAMTPITYFGIKKLVEKYRNKNAKQAAAK